MLADFKHALEKRYIYMIAELVAVGTEILLGNIVNTNSAYLSEKCASWDFLFTMSLLWEIIATE